VESCVEGNETGSVECVKEITDELISKEQKSSAPRKYIVEDIQLVLQPSLAQLRRHLEVDDVAGGWRKRTWGNHPGVDKWPLQTDESGFYSTESLRHRPGHR